MISIEHQIPIINTQIMTKTPLTPLSFKTSYCPPPLVMGGKVGL